MAIDAYKNFAIATVATAPSPATSGTTLVVTAGQGARFPAVPFNATVWPATALPDPTTAEIVRVTARTTDTLTITRAQEGSAARTIVAGDLIAATQTKKFFDDLLATVARLDTANTFVGNQTVDGDLIVTGEINPARLLAQLPKFDALFGARATGVRTLLSNDLTAGMSLRYDDALGSGRIAVGNADTQQYQDLQLEAESLRVQTGLSPVLAVHVVVHPSGGVTVGSETAHGVDPGVGVLVATGGLGTTPLHASNLLTGTVPDARLSATVPRRDQANVFTQPQTINANLTVGSPGLLTVNGLGSHTLIANGPGQQALSIRNLDAGAGSFASINMGNNLAAGRLRLHVFSSGFNPPAGYGAADTAAIVAGGPGGLSIGLDDVNAAIRFYTGGAVPVLAWTIAANGAFLAGTHAVGNTFTTCVPGLVYLGNAGTGPNSHLVFYNANGQVGAVTTSGSSTTYGTTSDQRLKRDLGPATDLSALRAVVVHDFEWLAGGDHDRGVFAQETAPIFPRAITVGTTGADLSQPWMTDYSTFVPDLIVAFQQLEARLARLEASQGRFT